MLSELQPFELVNFYLVNLFKAPLNVTALLVRQSRNLVINWKELSSRTSNWMESV